MESCNNQYINKRNNDLYIYSNSRTVCNDSNDGYCDYKSNHTSIYTDRTIVSELKCTGITWNINQWHQRNMEPCNNQYNNSGNNDLYIYSNSRTVCNDSNNGYCDYKSNHT